MNRYIVVNAENKVVGIRNGPSIANGEIESDTADIGQIMQSDGTFIDDPNPPQHPIRPSVEDELAEIKQQNLILMDAIATLYEQFALNGGV